MLRTIATFAALTLLGLLTSSLLAQDDPPVPTLTVPTLVPVAAADESADFLHAESAIAEIAATGILRLGLLYNDPPYSEFTFQGELRGFDIDLLRKVAAEWDCELEFAQVTRLNALEMLNSGDVHALASAIVRYRDRDAELEFSQTYLQGAQALLLREDSPFQARSELLDQPIGYVQGTRAEKATEIWSAQTGGTLNLQPYLTLDRAVAAVMQGEISAVVAEKQALNRVTADFAESVRILDDAVTVEPRAFAVRRQDAPLRDALNKTIQLLAREGELDVLFREYFPDESYNPDALAIWSGLGEEALPSQFANEIAYPATYALPRIRSTGRLRVGGITDTAPGSATGSLNMLNRALAAELARRWGVALEIVSGDSGSAAGLLNSGQADLVFGMKPDWNLAGQMDFSMPYLLHGDRLMVRANSGIRGFNDLRGRFVGILRGDDTARERAQAWADSINATVRYIQTTERDAALTLLDYNNANAIYADNLELLAHLEANPNTLRLTERWYSRSYYAIGLPYNDIDLRLLVDYTIQELIKDGSLYRLSASLIVSDSLPKYDLTPGLSSFAGFNLSHPAADPAAQS